MNISHDIKQKQLIREIFATRMWIVGKSYEDAANYLDTTETLASKIIHDIIYNLWHHSHIDNEQQPRKSIVKGRLIDEHRNVYLERLDLYSKKMGV